VLRRRLAIVIALSILAGIALTRLEAKPAQAAGCRDVLFVGARGSGEPYTPRNQGMGDIVGPLFRSAKQQLPGTGFRGYGLTYEARAIFPLDVDALLRSASSGEDLAVAQIELAVKACPNQRLVLAGYSQGAWVLGDVLGRLSLQAQQRIAAVALFGDPLFVPSPPTTVGGAPSRVGVLATQAPRTPYIPARFGALTRSYCRIHDPVCNYQKRYLALCSLPFDLGSACEHFHYADAGEEVDDAAVFVVAKLRRPVTASAGWPQLHYSADHTGYSPAERVLDPTTVRSLRKAWELQIQDPSLYLESSPVVAGGTVYVGGAALVAIDAAAGSLLWRRSGLLASSAPAVAEGMVFATRSSGQLAAFDAASGQDLWDPPGVEAYGSPTVLGSTVYTGWGTVAAVDAASRSVRWRLEDGTFSRTPSAVANGLVYTATNHRYPAGDLAAYDAATGALRWRVDLPMPVDPGVTVANGLVYTLDQYGNGLYAFDAATGALRWRRAGLGSFRSVPAVADGLLYQVSGGELVAVDAATGAIVWRSPGPTGTAAGAGTDSSPAVANGVVYAAWPGTATDGGVFAFDARTGAKLWHGATGDRGSNSSPAVVNGSVYVGADDGKVYAFRL
jgi:outer membrane protein assembly factor BamB